MSFTATPLRAVDDVITRSATEVVATKRIVADDPYLAGHFPDRPIYPGVFVIETVRQALAALTDAAALTAVRSLRLFAPLVPGDTLTAVVQCSPGSPGSPGSAAVAASAVCTRGDGERVATVSVELAPAAPDHRRTGADVDAGTSGAGAGGAMTHTELFHVLAHRHPMLLVDRVAGTTVVPGGSGSTSRAVKAVSAAEPCYAGLDAGADFAYPPVLLLESFLQSAALLWVRAAPQRSTGTVVLGGIRQVTFHGRVHPGDVVEHRLRLDTVRGGAAVLSGSATVAGAPVLVAESVLIARSDLTVVAGAGAR